MAEYDSTVKLGVDVEVNKSSLSNAIQTVSKAVNNIKTTDNVTKEAKATTSAMNETGKATNTVSSNIEKLAKSFGVSTSEIRELSTSMGKMYQVFDGSGEYVHYLNSELQLTTQYLRTAEEQIELMSLLKDKGTYVNAQSYFAGMSELYNNKFLKDLENNTLPKLTTVPELPRETLQSYEQIKSEYNAVKDSIASNNKQIADSVKMSTARMQNLFSYLKTVKLSGMFDDLPKSSERINRFLAVEQQFINATKQLSQLSSGGGVVSSIEKTFQQIDKLETELDKLYDKQANYLARGGERTDKAYIKMNQSVSDYKRELVVAQQSIVDLYNEFGLSVGTAGSQAFQKISRDFNTEMLHLKRLTSALNQSVSNFAPKGVVGTKELGEVGKDMTKVDSLSTQATELYTRMQELYSQFKSIPNVADSSVKNEMAILTTSMQGLDSLVNKLQALSKVTPSTTYLDTLKQYEGALKGISAIKSKQEDFLATGGKRDEKRYLALSQSLVVATNKANELRKTLATLSAEGQGGLDKSSLSTFNSLYQALTQRIDAMKSINAELSGSIKTATDAQNAQLAAEAQAEKQKEVDYNNRVAQYTKLGNAVGKVAKGTTNMATSMIRNSYAGKKATKAFNKLKGVFTGNGAEMEKWALN